MVTQRVITTSATPSPSLQPLVSPSVMYNAPEEWEVQSGVATWVSLNTQTYNAPKVIKLPSSNWLLSLPLDKPLQGLKVPKRWQLLHYYSFGQINVTVQFSDCVHSGCIARNVLMTKGQGFRPQRVAKCQSIQKCACNGPCNFSSQCTYIAEYTS